MAAYATVEDLKAISLPPKVVESVTSEAAEAALEHASRLADSYIGTRFRLPIAAWEADLTKVVCDIAAYGLMKRRGWNPGVADAEQIRLGYDDAVMWLKHVSQGVTSPFGIVQAEVSDATDETMNGFPLVSAPVQGGVTLRTSFGDEALGVVTNPKLRGW